MSSGAMMSAPVLTWLTAVRAAGNFKRRDHSGYAPRLSLWTMPQCPAPCIRTKVTSVMTNRSGSSFFSRRYGLLHDAFGGVCTGSERILRIRNPVEEQHRRNADFIGFRRRRAPVHLAKVETRRASMRLAGAVCVPIAQKKAARVGSPARRVSLTMRYNAGHWRYFRRGR